LTMAELILSESEKTFILHGVEQNFRVDGRTRSELRPIILETDIVSHASGSCHLRLANTDILVGVKAELETPLPATPNRGRVEFFVDCSANTTPGFEGRGGDNLAADISRVLARAYESPDVIDLKELCILAGKTCWILYVDILILEVGGNLYDAVSMAVKAALYSTKIPVVSVTSVDGGEPELELSDDPHSATRIKLEKAPVLVTLTRIGNQCVVDPTPEEETCSSASLLLAVSPSGFITTVKKIGGGSFQQDSIESATRQAVDVGTDVNLKLMQKLKQEEALGRKREKIGFL
jgi:exosome complex component RRP42